MCMQVGICGGVTGRARGGAEPRGDVSAPRTAFMLIVDEHGR